MDGGHLLQAAGASGFAAMACDELLVHTDDMAPGLELPLPRPRTWCGRPWSGCSRGPRPAAAELPLPRSPPGRAEAVEAGEVGGHLVGVAGGLGDDGEGGQAGVGQDGGEALVADGAGADRAVAVAAGADRVAGVVGVDEHDPVAEGGE